MKSQRVPFSTKERADIVRELKRRFGNICWYCGVSLDEVKMNIDHVLPVSDNGSNDIDNLALSCKYCNSHKLYYYVEDFINYLAYIRSDDFVCNILQDYKKVGIDVIDKLSSPVKITKRKRHES